MKYDFSNEATKRLMELDMNMAGRIIKGIMGLPNKGDIKTLDGNFKGYYRLRIGDLRILYKVNNDVIFISSILPRGDSYK